MATIAANGGEKPSPSFDDGEEEDMSIGCSQGEQIKEGEEAESGRSGIEKKKKKRVSTRSELRESLDAQPPDVSVIYTPFFSRLYQCSK